MPVAALVVVWLEPAGAFAGRGSQQASVPGPRAEVFLAQVEGLGQKAAAAAEQVRLAGASWVRALPAGAFLVLARRVAVEALPALAQARRVAASWETARPASVRRAAVSGPAWPLPA